MSKMYQVDVKKSSYIIETKEVWAIDEDDAVEIVLQLADKECSYEDFNDTVDHNKTTQMISVQEREVEDESYLEKQKSAKILFENAMKVEENLP
tara:strand:+ start:744 stop:1025 length:282 start_codon:yes stop_codon:yes gene_type:complete